MATSGSRKANPIRMPLPGELWLLHQHQLAAALPTAFGHRHRLCDIALSSPFARLLLLPLGSAKPGQSPLHSYLPECYSCKHDPQLIDQGSSRSSHSGYAGHCLVHLLGAGAVPPGTYCQTPQCHLVKRPRLRGLPD